MPPPEPTQTGQTRLYKVWKGNNIFLCGGRLIFGPDGSSIFLSTVLISGPLIALCCQVMVKHRSQNWDDKQILGLPVLIVTIVAGAADLMFLFMTSSRDPGIVPRNKYPPDSDEFSETASMSSDWVSSQMRLPRMKNVFVNGFSVKVKYCDTCLLYRPPRTSHCSICNNCVQKFDHHCPWVGQCIGIRNYRFFLLFISTSTFLCLYVFIISWLNIISQKKNHHNSILKSMTGEALSLVLIVYTFVTIWFVGGLTAFHTYLLNTNQTTYENFRYHYSRRENPYNRGALGNFMEVFFAQTPPSLNNFRAWVAEEEQETGRDRNRDVPAIFRGLDFSDIDSSLTSMNGMLKPDTGDPFAFPSDRNCRGTPSPTGGGNPVNANEPFSQLKYHVR